MSCAACQRYCTAEELGVGQYLDLDRLCASLECCRVTGNNRLFLEKGDLPGLTDRICKVENTALRVKNYTAHHGNVMHKYVLPSDITDKNHGPPCYKLLRVVTRLPARARRTYRHVRDKVLLLCELPTFLGILRLINTTLASWARETPSVDKIQRLTLLEKHRDAINETESSQCFYCFLPM